MTYYDPTTKTFAALGHEIAEEGQSWPADVTMGQIFEASVVSVRRSTSGTPGEKICQSESLIPIGAVSKNTIYGLYGKVQSPPSPAQSVTVASRQEVSVGPAEIYTVIQGTTPRRYAIRITEVRRQNEQAVKGIRFQITDTESLDQTGGIIQGMSGSPILQNGKLIGAVTHMVTSQPDSGYGIYIDWMLEEAQHE